MAVLFLIFLDQICPKWNKLDQTWSNWISHQSKNITIKSCHIYRTDKNDCFVFDFFGSDLSKINQTWSNLIKMDFHQSKNVIIKSCHIYRKDQNDCFIFDFFGSDLSKMDQTWSNLIKLDSSPIKMLLLFLIFWIRSVKLFGQKRFFGSNGFSAETAFCPKILVSNLKWLFG